MRNLKLLNLIVVLYTISVISCKEEEEILPIASFMTENSIARINDTIRFINQSENAESYIWSFGDGATSIEKNPIHVYNKLGTYDIELITINSQGNDTVTQSLNVQGLILDVNAISAKWEITTSTIFKSIEFFECGKFLLARKDQENLEESIFRDYTISSEDKIDIQSYGSLEEIVLTPESIKFNMNILESNEEPILITASKSEISSNSAKTEMISGYWRAISYNGVSVEDSNLEIELLLSKYGTYNYQSMDNENGIYGYGMFNWIWENTNEEILCYSSNELVDCNEYNEIQIEVESSILTVTQNGNITVLEPIKN